VRRTIEGVRSDNPELRALAEDAAVRLEHASATEVIAWAAHTFGARLVVTSSMGDGLLAHLAGSVVPGIDVLFLDTGYHFAETLGTRDAVGATTGVRVRTVLPELTVAEQDKAYGAELFARDPDACCRMRKVEPLARAMADYDAWISGVRRDETPERAGTPVVAFDAARGKVKVHPIATWTQEQADAYIAAHGILVNPLVSEGFLSIGCAPCTRAVRPGEDPRAGRWAGQDKTECGLHT
jgi:phosphoadenosine phosphosulfate reductase